MLFNGWMQYIGSFAAGIVTSILYHGGLWWTVKALPRSRSPLLLSIGSFYLRISITMAAFYVVMQNDWKRLAVCMAGFMAVKFVITRRTGGSSACIPGKGRMH